MSVMSASETVRPRPRAFWADARFLLGLALIVASVAGVWLVVATARQSAPVFAAARTLVPGEEVTAADLRVVEVTLGAVSATYASPAALTPGAVALRTVPEGELVPLSALGDRAAETRTTVVVRTDTDVAASVDAGADVEVWVAPAEGAGEPRILVPRATVVSVTRDDALVARAAVSLELVVARAEVPAVLAALADGSALAVVPIAGGGR